MSPSGVEDKDRRPHDSLTVELNRLPSHHYSAQSKQPPAFILTTPNGRSNSNTITYKPLKFLNLYIINLTEKLNRIASVNACLTSWCSDDVTQFDNAFMLQRTMLSYLQDIMAHMYQEDTDRPQPLITEQDTLSAASLIHWWNDLSVKATEANINSGLFIYDRCTRGINQTNKTMASTAHPLQGRRVFHWN